MILSILFSPSLLPYIFGVPGLAAIAGVSGVAARIVGMVYRMKIREKFMIPGNGCEDCLCHWFCTCCAIAQEARHVDRDTGLMPMPAGMGYQPQQ